MSEFRMPSLGADMDAGTLVEWMKQPGDHVQRGEAIAAVETQKGAIEIEAFESGTLEDIRVDIGQKVPVGTVLAYIRNGDEEAAAPRADETSPPPPTEPQPPAAPPPAPSVPSVTHERRVTPAARRRARELGVDPSTAAPDAEGVVGLREVEAAATGTAKARERKGIDFDEMRKAIAAAMARSWREIPHYFVSSTLDMEPLLDWLEQVNAQRPVTERLLYVAPLIKATALALKATPALNGQYTEQGFQRSRQVHLGVAVAIRGGGLIAPAILDADTLDLATVMQRLNDLVTRVRGGRLRSSEMTAATATLSNLGEDTADALQPVIYPPQVAIVGCGRIAPRPWAGSDGVVLRRTLTVTVGGDHRVSDGRAAARFLGRLNELLQHPEQL